MNQAGYVPTMITLLFPNAFEAHQGAKNWLSLILYGTFSPQDGLEMDAKTRTLSLNGQEVLKKASIHITKLNCTILS